jgi:hypothetical protein
VDFSKYANENRREIIRSFGEEISINGMERKKLRNVDRKKWREVVNRNECRTISSCCGIYCYVLHRLLINILHRIVSYRIT